MVFKHLRWGVLWRVALLFLLMAIFLYLITFEQKYVTTFITGLLIVGLTYNLVHFVESTNRRLVRFFDSIRYEDLSVNFRASEQMGSSFKELTAAFEEVLELIRTVRAESQENLQYLQTVVQHVQVGLLAWDDQGRISLLNQATKRFLSIKEAGSMEELKRKAPAIMQRISGLAPGQSLLLPVNQELCLAVNATALKLRNKHYTLISLQNILSELQSTEIEAWQNLTRVLRHEIMNSVAPISTLVSALRDMLEEEREQLVGTENFEDFSEGLATIESRTRALIRFVEAYRNYNDIPQPQFKTVMLRPVLDRAAKLMGEEIRQAGLTFDYDLHTPDLQLSVDGELLEMVLINLLKNAREALQEKSKGWIRLEAGIDQQQVQITVTDNGPGIAPEQQDQVFIPFYTTKPEGSGIGLALSRQIIRQHGGTLMVESQPGQGSTFTIRL